MLRWFATLMLGFVLTSCQSQFYSKNAPKAIKGQLDARSWDFSGNVFLEMKGEWICRGLNEADECKEPESLRTLPFSRWRSYGMVTAGQSFHSRLETRVLLPENLKEPVYLHIRDVFGAYKVTLSDPNDGTIFYQKQFGTISSRQDESIPVGGEVWTPMPSRSAVRVEIEVSSVAGSYGLFRPPILARPALLNEQRETNTLQMAMMIGAFVLLGLYSLALFAQRTQDKGHLIIGSLSLALALRQLASEQLITRVVGWSQISFYVQSDILFMSYLSTLLLFSIYLFHRTGKLEAYKNWIWIGVALQVLIEMMAYAVQFLQAKIFLGVVFGLFAYFFALLVAAFIVIFRRKAEEADLHLLRLSLLIPVSGIVYDGGVAQLSWDLPYLAHYTLLAFILAQSILVGRSFARSFNENERLLVEVREKEKSRTVFFHNTSHELRTPLNGIIGFLELLMAGRYGELNNEAIAQLQKCVRLAQSLKNQVNTILDLAKSRRGTLELSNSQFRIADLVNEVQDLAEGLLLKYKPTEFVLKIDPDLIPRLWIGDYGKIATILRNLLGNAFKFADPGRPNQVTLHLALNAHQLQIEVSDTGIGIAAEQQGSVFEEFKQIQGDARRSYEGTGLGLSMVRDLTRLMQGSIVLQSVPGQGSRFYVNVPEQKTVHMTGNPELVERQSSRTRRLVSAARLMHKPPVGSSKGRILVVDDNEINCEVLQDLLQGEGFEVIVAYGGQEALQKARAVPPDLMLLDMMMPQMSGEDVLKEMKQDPMLEEVPVILVTARASEDDRIFGLSLGADDYLAKPIQHEELSFRVRNLLRRIETIHRTGAIEERERMAQLGDMMRELSHELKNLFQLGKLDPETIRESSQQTLNLLPLQGAVWQKVSATLSQGQHLEEPDVSQLVYGKAEEATNRKLRSLRFILGSIPLAADDRQEIWQNLRQLNPQQQATCEQVLILVRSYQLLEQQAEHAADLVASILDYSRNSQNLGASPLDEVWATLFRMIHPRLKKNKITIRKSTTSVTLPIHTNHLMQVLMNLISNAIDAMQALPPHQRWIELNARTGALLELSVSNAGAPIPADIQERLFERGVSSKGQQGSGLGLFVSRKLVQRSAGQIRYDTDAAHPRFVLTWKNEGEDAIRKVS